MTKPSESDLEKVERLISRALSAALNLDDDIQWWMRRWLPEALADERTSLPESALKEIHMAISYLRTAVGVCERLHKYVGDGDPDASYIMLSGEFEQAHDDLKEELEKIRRWQQDGPEPKEQV